MVLCANLKFEILKKKEYEMRSRVLGIRLKMGIQILFHICRYRLLAL